MELPFNGSGQSHLTATGTGEWIPYPIAYTAYVNYTVTSDGYLNLSSATTQNIRVADHYGHFEGLNAGDEENYLTSELVQMYHQQYFEWLPFDQYLTEFLKELFGETPYAEIIKP